MLPQPSLALLFVYLISLVSTAWGGGDEHPEQASQANEPDVPAYRRHQLQLAHLVPSTIRNKQLVDPNMEESWRKKTQLLAVAMTGRPNTLPPHVSRMIFDKVRTADVKQDLITHEWRHYDNYHHINAWTKPFKTHTPVEFEQAYRAEINSRNPRVLRHLHDPEASAITKAATQRIEAEDQITRIDPRPTFSTPSEWRNACRRLFRAIDEEHDKKVVAPRGRYHQLNLLRPTAMQDDMLSDAGRRYERFIHPVRREYDKRFGRNHFEQESRYEQLADERWQNWNRPARHLKEIATSPGSMRGQRQARHEKELKKSLTAQRQSANRNDFPWHKKVTQLGQAT